MSLAARWNDVERGLDPRWTEARLLLRIEDHDQVERALALLGPAAPGRSGSEIRFFVDRQAGVGPEAVRRMLKRIDAAGIGGALELLSAEAAPPAPQTERPALAADWDAALSTLPADWSDLLCELELTSSDHIEHAALLTAPMNPLLAGTANAAFQFRVASSQGYGAAPDLVRRLLERLDEAGIPGHVRVLRSLSDTHPVGTQGPVWHVGGKMV